MSPHTEEKVLPTTREALASAWTRREDLKPDRRTALMAGLSWLLRTEQSDQAICQHHGVVIHTRGNRYFSFLPGDVLGRATVAVSVYKVKRNPNTLEVQNPLFDGEMKLVQDLLEDLGERVVDTWNGDGRDSGSLALTSPVAPSLLAAVARYRAGCPDHPSKTVFCDCGWFRRGFEKLTLPSLPDMAA